MNHPAAAALIGALVLAGCAADRQEFLPASGGARPLAALLEAGKTHYGAGDVDSAEASFSAALTLSREQGVLEAEAHALVGLGMVAYRRDDYAAARRLLGQALDLQHRHGITTHLWRANNLLGLVAYYSGQYYESLERHGLAAELAVAAGDTVSLAKSWNNVALARIELGDYAEARTLLLRSLPVARATGQRLVEGRVLVNLGMLAVRTGDAEAALRFLNEARDPLSAVEDEDGEQNRLGQIGTALAAMGEPGRAIAYLDTALAQARAQESPQEVASNLEHMASVYRDAGDYPRALRMFEEARALNDTLGLRDEAAYDLRSIAEIHLELGNRDLAVRSAGQALEIHRALGNRLDMLHGLLLLARLAQEGGKPDAAARFLVEAKALADGLAARAPHVAVALTAARVADQAGDSRAVLRELSFLGAELATGGTDVEWEAHWLRGRAHARLGRLEAAVTDARRAVDLVERVRGEFGSGMLRTRYQSARERVYRDLVEVLLRSGNVEEAFEAADGSRGRVLLEHLATIRTDGATTPRELAEEERQLLRQIDTITVALARMERPGEGNGSRALENELTRMTAEVERVRAEYTVALTRAEERRGPTRALAGGIRPSAATVRAALRPEEALVAWYLTDDRILTFVVTANGVSCLTRPVERAALTTRVRVVRELAGRREGPGGGTAALEALHQTLLEDVIGSSMLAGVGTLILVPHGELEYVPFAALRSRISGRYLVEDYTLLHLPSAAALPALRHRGAEWRGLEGAMAFAPFTHDLPASAAELEAIGKALAGSRLRRGNAASEPAVREALGSAPVVHLATHGVLNARSPLFSRVELAGPRRPADPEADGRLEVHEVHRLAITAVLVFLSGCETGLGLAGHTGFSTGEDYATLTRAFLGAGAANVIATLWRVEDRGAAELAGRFYRELAAAAVRGRSGGAAVAEALSRAQREMLREAAWQSPFYWAGFRLTGSGGLDVARMAALVRS